MRRRYPPDLTHSTSYDGVDGNADRDTSLTAHARRSPHTAAGMCGRVGTRRGFHFRQQQIGQLPEPVSGVRHRSRSASSHSFVRLA
ncbi:MAG: hypothetical protein JWM45_204 [Pseudonocardiales bacterium]|jgi:hypothetical protein|nr:hypothetical protein [Pseudonocardiales bacterium]